MGTASESFQKNLHRIRKDRLRLTQSEAAEAIGISLRYYQQLEKGDSWPSPETWDAICKAFKCQIWELLRLEADSQKPVPKAQEKRAVKVDDDGLAFADAAAILGALAELPRSNRRIALAVLLEDLSWVDGHPEAERHVSFLISKLK